MNHSAIVLTLTYPDRLIGFWVENGNTPQAQAIYNQLIHRDGYAPEHLAMELMVEAKQIMEAHDYTCGAITIQSRDDWMEEILGRSLTGEERREHTYKVYINSRYHSTVFSYDAAWDVIEQQGPGSCHEVRDADGQVRPEFIVY